MKYVYSFLVCVLVSPGAVLYGAAVLADEADAVNTYKTTASISGSVLSNAAGRVAVNQAAGDMNQQLNAGAVAVSDGGSAAVRVIAEQSTAAENTVAPAVASASISGAAFGNVQGMIAVNQLAGVANTQRNTVEFTASVIGLTEIDETQLALHAATPAVESGPQLREVSIGPEAFSNAEGLIQVNQAAGSGNASANNVYLHFK